MSEVKLKQELRKHLREKRPLLGWNESQTTESPLTSETFSTDSETSTTPSTTITRDEVTNQGRLIFSLSIAKTEYERNFRS